MYSRSRGLSIVSTGDKSPVWSSVPLLWALVIALSALMVRVLFLSAPLASDDAIYFDLASRLSVDIFDTQRAQWPFRTGMLMPLAAVQAFFGFSLWSYYIFSVGFSVALVVVVFVVMRNASGLRAAIIASLLFSTSGLVLYQGTNILPDVPNLCFLLLSFHVFTKVDDPNTRRGKELLALAAGCGFYSYLVRAPNAVFLIAIPVYEYLAHRTIRRTLRYAAVFAAFVAGECLFYLIVTGNPLKRLMLVPKGVTLWIKHQPTLSLEDYVLRPFSNLTRWKTGWVLIGCAIPAAIYVVRRRHHKLMALLAGGLFIFVVYSYTVTSFSPLMRALPLQPRYILAFTCVLAMIGGHWLANLEQIPKLKIRLPRFVVPGVAAALIAVQVSDLPKLPTTMFFTDDAFYVGDRLVRDYLRQHAITEPVYAYPDGVFKLFGGYSELKLVSYSPSSPPEPGRYYLIYKPRLIRTVRAARIREDNALVRHGEALLNGSPAWHTVLETSSVVLFYVTGRAPALVPVIDLAEHEDVWKAGKGIERRTGGGLAFTFDAIDKHAYISTFDNSYSKPGPADHPMNDALRPGRDYEIEIHYRLEKPVPSLRFFFHEYDMKRRVQKLSRPMSNQPGPQTFRTSMKTTLMYDSFRVFFRVTNKQHSNAIHIDSVVISELR